MARPFPTTFEKDQSPLSPGSGSNTPISYQTNVNRQKTKKWANAKPADYGGDDWGDDDDYDLPPLPVSKPTGLRQQGQALQSPSVPPAGDKKNYGDLPPLPGAPGSSSTRPRVNSFGVDEEKRNFSSSTVRQPSPAQGATAPPTRFSQITGVPSTREPSGPPALSITTQQLPQQPAATGLRKANQIVSPLSGSPHPSVLQPGPARTNTGDSGPAFSGPSRINTGESDLQSFETRTPSSDYQARRDYSPTAVPAPLSTIRASPAPQSARYPARNSSLSQSSAPDLAETNTTAQETTTPKPWVGGGSSSQGASTRSPTSPSGKALPFIRPADIYRRVEEEKERERQSMDSGRPSMDSIVGAKSSDRSDSPANPLREKTSSDNLGGGRQRTSLDRDEIPAAGRQSIPVLEPVKERKSEYGFEGFNVDEQASKTAETKEQTQMPSQSAQLDIQRARSSSVSPKLPDLNRISGFGIDLFSLPKTDEPEPPMPLQSTSTTTNSNIIAPPQVDGSLRQQPFGYPSVGHEFDRKNNPSTPPTPASQIESHTRADSENTGATGISSIMSSTPSSAVSGVRVPEGSTPSILEAVHETTQPVSKEDIPANNTFTSGINPSNRRDIRTHSPGNSPNRTPDLAKAKSLAQSQEAVLADPSSPETIMPISHTDPLQPPRPTFTEREKSFRPNIPGSWTSYSTIARSETPQQDSTRASKELERAQTPASQISSTHEQYDRDDHNITPTASKHSLPQVSVGTAGGAALGGMAGAAVGRHEKESSREGPTSETFSEVRGNSALPIPDSTPATSSNLYSTTPLDTQILPNAESAWTAPQADEQLALPAEPQALPIQSTDGAPQPQDQESDKLHNEIIESLSPRPSDATSHDSLLPGQLDEQKALKEDRFSTSSYLPKEYDNYWATSSEEADPGLLATSAAQDSTEEAVVAEQNPQLTVPPTVMEESSATGIETSSISTINARRTSLQKDSRPSMPNRFSWETSHEGVSQAQSQDEIPELPVNLPHQRPTEGHAEIATTPSSRAEEEPYSQPPAVQGFDDGLIVDPLSPVSNESSDNHALQNSVLLTGGAALGGGAAAAVVQSYPTQSPQQSPQHERRLSLAEEKDLRVSSYPVSPTPPEDEHPSRSPQAYFSGPSADQPAPSAAPSSVSPVNSPIITQFSPTSRILAFKEIAAMKSPHQRIQTFNETRHRFAAMDSGLVGWMTTLKAQHQEHANTTGSWSGAALPIPNGSARSKYSKEALPPIQQPYYQQYLNASPTTPGTPVSRPGPNIPSGSQQGLSPAGGKKTTQGQGKGKDLLHTAGIFGGKAGKAGKGLLAKGKSKLRGSGAGDKTQLSPSPPAKSKNERRTSWGFPVAMSRSSGRPDGSARQSKESIPMPTSDSQQNSTMNPATGFHALEIPKTMNRDSPLIIGPTIPTPQSQAVKSNESTSARAPVEEYAANGETEERDSMGIPAPTAKHQPSWNGANDTSIVEDGLLYDERQKQEAQALSSAPQNAFSNSEDLPSKSDRSNSGDAQFYDASEDPPELNDWVMVSPAEAIQVQSTAEPEPESKQVEPKVQSKIEPQSKEAPEIYQPPDGPPPSFLKRQQMQDLLEPETYHTPEGPPPGFQNKQAAPVIAKAPELPPSIVFNQAQTYPKVESEVSRASEEPPASVLDRPRYSYEASLHSQTSPPRLQAQSNISNSSSIQQNLAQSAGEQKDQQVEADEPSKDASFKGLPPIRRTSTFGLGFGSRKPKQRFPIDDDEDSQRANSENYENEIGAAAGAATVAAYAAQHDRKDQPRLVHHTPASTNLSQQRKDSADQPATTRPEPNDSLFPNNSQRTTIPEFAPQRDFQVPRATDASPEGFRRSQDAWRPNPVVSTSPTSPPKYSGAAMPPQRPSVERQRSLEGQRSRAVPESTQIAARPDIQNNDRGPRPIMTQPQRPMLYDQPPSSAQRYPELFPTLQQSPPDLDQDGELPLHMYQAPLPREATFLPRQQTNEYQLPNVGPPPTEPRSDRSRRNSGSFLRELGGRLSRGTSRERGNSISRDGEMSLGGRAIDSRGNEYPESSIASDEAQEQQKRRSSFFGNLHRASTTGLGPPQSRESVVAHFPTSRVDLLGTPQPSPIEHGDKKRSIFGTSSPNSSKPNKLTRSSTSGMIEESGKKKRFSGLSNMFSRPGGPSTRSSVQDRPQPTRELSHDERQPIESPQLEPRQPPTLPPPSKPGRGSSQQRQLLSKLSTGGDPSKASQESKTRRASASSLLSGIMGRKSDLKDREKEGSSSGRSQGGQSQGGRSQASQPGYHPQQVPLGRTYTDLQEESPEAPSGPPPPQVGQPQQKRSQERPPHSQSQERGRRTTKDPRREFPRELPREPQYDSVPIPGGYSLVRGQGAMTVPTEYDPRGLNRLQQQQSQGIYPQSQPSLQAGAPRQRDEQPTPQRSQPDARHISQGNRPPALTAVETYESYTKRTSPRLSHEELLARSPAREQPGQQRPYQLSLPEDEEDRDHGLNPQSRSPPTLSLPNSSSSPKNRNMTQPKVKQPDAIQRLQNPVLRHPESPAGYPLPEDSVFSPVNDAARDLPPPPPPKWPSHLEDQYVHDSNPHISAQHLKTEPQLDRSNTRHTAVSAVSGMSGPKSPGLHPPHEDGREGVSPSPTPPSPAYTPERADSPPSYDIGDKDFEGGVSPRQERGELNVRTAHANRGSSPDLYSASPKFPPNASSRKPATNAQSNPETSRAAQGSLNSTAAYTRNDNTSTVATVNNSKVSNPESAKTNGHSTKRTNDAQEEKIYYDAETGEEGHAEDAEVTMSATSYPGQEWNPYAGGGWEEGFD